MTWLELTASVFAAGIVFLAIVRVSRWVTRIAINHIIRVALRYNDTQKSLGSQFAQGYFSGCTNVECLKDRMLDLCIRIPNLSVSDSIYHKAIWSYFVLKVSEFLMDYGLSAEQIAQHTYLDPLHYLADGSCGCASHE